MKLTKEDIERVNKFCLKHGIDISKFNKTKYLIAKEILDMDPKHLPDFYAFVKTLQKNN